MSQVTNKHGGELTGFALLFAFAGLLCWLADPYCEMWILYVVWGFSALIIALDIYMTFFFKEPKL